MNNNTNNNTNNTTNNANTERKQTLISITEYMAPSHAADPEQ